MIKFLLGYFGLSLVGLSLLKWDALDPAIDGFCLGLAKATWGLAYLFDSSVTLSGAVLRHGDSGFALEVTDVCSALPASWLLLSALLLFPAPWSRRWPALLLALPLVQTLNLVRLLSLFYLGDGYPQWFDLVHEQLWPILLHAGVLVLFALWLGWSLRPLAAPAETPAHAA